MATIWDGHFDSTKDDDRPMTAEDWATYNRVMFTDGIANGGRTLQVNPAPGGLAVDIEAGEPGRDGLRCGYAAIQGYVFRLAEDHEGDTYRLGLPPAHPQLPRIDRVILRLDRRIEVRHITPEVKLGTADASPDPPELERGGNVWEISLAQVYIPAGAAAVTAQMITDERFDEGLCGLIHSLLDLAPGSFRQQMDKVIEARIAEFDAQMSVFQAVFDGKAANMDAKAAAFQGWFDAAQNNIATLQTFVFDNMAALSGAAKTTAFNPDGSISAVITDVSSGLTIADETTAFNADGTITMRQTLYEPDGLTVRRQRTVTTAFNADGTISEVVL